MMHNISTLPATWPTIAAVLPAKTSIALQTQQGEMSGFTPIQMPKKLVVEHDTKLGLKEIDVLETIATYESLSERNKSKALIALDRYLSVGCQISERAKPTVAEFFTRQIEGDKKTKRREWAMSILGKLKYQNDWSMRYMATHLRPGKGKLPLSAMLALTKMDQHAVRYFEEILIEESSVMPYRTKAELSAQALIDMALIVKPILELIGFLPLITMFYSRGVALPPVTFALLGLGMIGYPARHTTDLMEQVKLKHPHYLARLVASSSIKIIQSKVKKHEEKVS